MSMLQEFLNTNQISDVTEEVIVSERIKDDKGNMLKFKIRALNETELEEVNKFSFKSGKRGKVDFNVNKYNRLIVVKGTLDPNFEDAKSIKQVGCITPEDYIKKVLLPGEIATLSEQIQQLSGFKDLEELIEEAKK